MLVAHTRWRNLHALSRDRNFVVITDHPHEELRPDKVRYAVFCFACALGLVLFFVTLGLNVFALRIVQRYREKYD